MSDQPQQVYNGRYELHRRIARGGMAEVFLARDALLDRPVAVKVLFPEFATDPSFVERFRREAQSAANLSHPNIVSVYDWGEEGSTYFIVMEYVEGRSLAQIIKDEGAFHPDRAADITADTAAALGFAHRNGVVHRDVKPGNILINPSGTVKVADFGIARAVAASENLTQTGTVMGTATYFSPEQAKGEVVDPRSDVYSLGVVLYEMLTGRPPFSGDNPVSVAYKHVNETPATPSSINPDVPAALEAVVHKVMAKDPANRYATAEELGADLQRFRSGQQVHAVTVMAAPVAATQATRAVVAPVGATTAIPAVEGTRAVRRVEEVREEVGTDPRERRSSAGFVIALLALLALLGLLLYFLWQTLGLGGAESTAEVEVPSVISLATADATRNLTAARLETSITEEPNEQASAGTVFAQDPAGGVNVEEGTTVELRVSAGAPPVAVPGVVGLNLDDAVGQLEGRGLTVDARPVEDEDRPEGEVLSQEPPEGEEVPTGTAVVLEVSSGPPLVPVPDVVGLSEGTAQNNLRNDGFVIAAPIVREAASAPAGEVVRTSPPAGTELEDGATVIVTVSTGPAPTTTTSTTTPTTTSTSTTSSTTTTSTTSTSTTLVDEQERNGNGNGNGNGGSGEGD